MNRTRIAHKVYTSYEEVLAPKRIYRSLVRQAVIVTLKSEGVDIPCVVNVLITNGKVIRRYNREYRQIDKPTDVLSFPMQVFDEAGWAGRGDLDIDEDSGLLPLGDIVMSMSHVRRQARIYGYTLEHETSHMMIHSTLHLLGYDHMEEEDKNLMQFREKQILEGMGYFA